MENGMFRDRMVRSGLLAAGVALGAHLLTGLVPGTFHIFSLLQSSVAVLAILSLALLVVTHHRSEVRFLSQTQEEVILIAAFGLFWFAVLMGFRAFRQLGESPGAAAYSDVAQTRSGSGGGGGYGVGGGRPSYCGENAVYCMEEWYY